MRRANRIWLPIVLAIAATTALALPAAARPSGPVRSGTILGGTAATTQLWAPAMLLDGCEATPECLAWVRSGCEPALAGRDVAVTSSIENVAGLRGTHRTFQFGQAHPGGGLAWGGVEIQFWRRDCTEIRGRGWASWHSWYDESLSWHSAELRIPAAARWMTVTGSQDTVHIRWTLT